MFLLKNEEDTARLARGIAAHLREIDCLTLTGNLGTGKTTLMRYLIGAMQDSVVSCQSSVVSPSFMIVQEYEVVVSLNVTEQGENLMEASRSTALVRDNAQAHCTKQEAQCRSDQKTKTILYHVDGYRLNSAHEIPQLGLEECFETGIVAIEWPEVFADYLPKNRLELTLELEDNGDGFSAFTERGEARSEGGEGNIPHKHNQIRRAYLKGKGTHEASITQIGKEFHGNA